MKAFSVDIEYEGSIKGDWHKTNFHVLVDDGMEYTQINQALGRRFNDRFRVVQSREIDLPIPILLDEYYRGEP